MLFAAGIVEWSLDIAKMVIAAVLTYAGTRLVEGYKVKEARQDAADARRLAAEKSAEASEQAAKDKKDFQEEIASLRIIMSQLSSQLAARREGSVEDEAADEEGVLELGLTDTLNFQEDVRVEIIRADQIPTNDGVYLLKVAQPLVDSPRFVHFSWTPTSFRVRDYIGGRMLHNQGVTPRRQAGFKQILSPLDRDAVWASATERLPAVGEFYHAAPDFGWWRQKLIDLAEGEKLLNSSEKAVWTKDKIIETLDRRQRRATYGAIAGIVGGAAQGVMVGRPKSLLNSWVVAASSRKGKPDPETGEVINSRRGWPTGYKDHEIHPACLQQIHDHGEDFIDQPSSLIEWLEAEGKEIR